MQVAPAPFTSSSSLPFPWEERERIDPQYRESGTGSRNVGPPQVTEWVVIGTEAVSLGRRGDDVVFRERETVSLWDRERERRLSLGRQGDDVVWERGRQCHWGEKMPIWWLVVWLDVIEVTKGVPLTWQTDGVSFTGKQQMKFPTLVSWCRL